MANETDPEIEAAEQLDDQADEIRSTPTIRAQAATIDDVDKKGRTIVAVVNDDTVDEYDTVILPKGGDLRQYQKNGPLLWCHRTELPPLGQVVWIALRDGKSKIKAKFRFDEDEFAELIFSKYESGSMKGVSLRFDPEWDQACAPTAEELKDRPDWKKARVIYRKWKLTEVSAVALMGNENCMAEEVKRGAVPYLPDNVREACDRLAKATPPPAKDPVPKPEPALPRLTGAVSFESMNRAIAGRLAQINPEQLVRAARTEAIARRRGVI